MKKIVLVRMEINGTDVSARVNRELSLLEFIREELHLTGTKKGCGTGHCGSCVVLIDGRARTTCNLPALRANGHRVLTIEGLAEGERLHPIQEAFVETGAIQCGYCTPGMVLRARDLLDHNPRPTVDEIKDAISSHICRCTGYVKIIDAIQLASGKMQATAHD
jgi:carbon-monoxide dehydrogenase small subunit